LTELAVKVTRFPKQEGFDDEAMETLTGEFVLTVRVMAFDVAGFPLVQGRFDVRVQVMTSPETGVYE
jgi:hypothetical protein